MRWVELSRGAAGRALGLPWLYGPQVRAWERPGDAGRGALRAAAEQVAGIVEGGRTRGGGAARAGRGARAGADRRGRPRRRQPREAAEQEAEEILHAARSQAEAARNEALSAVGAIHAEAERVRGEAEDAAEQVRAAAHGEGGADAVERARPRPSSG